MRSWNHGWLIDDNNEPSALAGAYLITNLIESKSYVGASLNIRRRLLDHLSGVNKKDTKLYRAVRDYGTNNFVVRPIFYVVDNSLSLAEFSNIEAQLILTYDTITNGYNLAIGDPRQSKVMTQLWQTSEYRDSRAAAFARIDVQDKRSAAIKAAMAISERMADVRADPEIQARRIANTKLAWSDPTLRAEQSQRLKTHLADPENYAQRVAQLATVTELGLEAAHKVTKGSIWITDEKTNRRVPACTALPDGWRLGRAAGKYGPDKGWKNA
jgi:hypothetical protein